MTKFCKQTYETSFTRNCFSFTPFCGSVGWLATWGEDGPALNQNPQIRRLVELECAVIPVPLWAQRVARQIDTLPPCGWSFPQHVEAVSTNIGRHDAEATTTLRCYTPGPGRLAMLSHIALLLDGWLKQVSADTTAAAITRIDSIGRDWSKVTSIAFATLGEHEPRKCLLVQRLLERLRFWLRAPYEGIKSDENTRLGYLYVPELGQYGGWDYMGFEFNDVASKELDNRIRQDVDDADVWLDLISSTWPCAPKVVRFVERIICAAGKISTGNTSSIKILRESMPTTGTVLPVDGTYLSSQTSREMYDTVLHALGEYVQDEFPLPHKLATSRDQDWNARLKLSLGKRDDVKLWLTSLLLERIILFDESFKSFHFTRSVNHAYGE
jgi:hypothetical protein